MTTPLTLDERVLRASTALSHAGIPHAFSGAISLGFWTEPRTTQDLDIAIFLPESAGLRTLETLGVIGVSYDPIVDLDRIERDGQVRLRWEHVPVDLFFQNLPFLESAAERVSTRPYAGGQIPVLSAEDLIVCKVLFNRARDWADIRAILATGGQPLDLSYIRTWLAVMIGEDHPSAVRFSDVARATRPTTEAS